MMDKEQTAMERLRLASDMSLRLYHRPLLLTDSGGKDSAVICKLAERQRRGKMDGSWSMGATGVDVFHWWMEDGVLPGQFEIEEEE